MAPRLGSEAVSTALVTGSFLGVQVSQSLAATADVLGDSVQNITGKRPHRLLVADFGLVEVTFDNEPDWTCRHFSLQLHRLSTIAGLPEETEQQLAIRFEEKVRWGDVSAEARRLVDLTGTSPSWRAGATVPSARFENRQRGLLVTALGVPGDRLDAPLESLVINTVTVGRSW